MKKDPFINAAGFLMAAAAMLILPSAAAAVAERAQRPWIQFINVHIFDGLSVGTAQDRA